MTSQTLREARKYEEAFGKRIPKEDKPAFHLAPWVGWMNDPNGFSYYKGQYHMFYQYHPYDSFWGPMHWGHAVSKDLLHWEYMPAALAPDEYYDKDGVFSGSAIELKDGRQLLIYTGVVQKITDNGYKMDYQTQCVAIGDGVDYEKYEGNPVITAKMLPEGGSVHDFRDPKIWKRPDGTYRMLCANRPADQSGQLLLYRSFDAIHWEFFKVFAENKCRLGRMWECPDFFELDGKGVVLVSPQDMLPEGFEYHNGNGTVCLIGSYDSESETFTEEVNQAVDYGIDFYAMQTVLTTDGRRVMIGWMQNWDTATAHERFIPWFGQMSLPRELHIVDNKLYQLPIRELEEYRQNKVEYKGVRVEGNGIINSADYGTTEEIKKLVLDGVNGRTIDMELVVSKAEKIFNKFTISLAANEEYHTDISIRPKENIVQIDRKFSGSRRAVIHQRRAYIPMDDDKMKLRIILDRFSMEIFINDGEKVMTATISTGQDAKDIYFTCDRDAIIDVTKYDLVL